MLKNILIAALVIFFAVPSFAQGVIETAAKQAVVIDYDTGAVLLEKNADERMPTSSMSKIMTMYVVFDAMKKGQLNLETQFPVSERAWNTQGSKMFVELGNMIKVEDLIRGVIIQSGNDATIVLAEGISGSEDVFAKNMTTKAHELGMKNSNFVNASGWPDDNHYSTARDLSILGRALIHDFPDQYKYYSEKDFTYHGIKQGNRNPLLYLNIGGDGIKTGHTEAAGYGLVGSGMQNGRRVVFVLNGMKDMPERAQEAGKILEWALKNFKNISLFKGNDTVGTAKVAMGTAEMVPLVVKDTLAVTVPATSSDGYTATINYKEPLIAPVKQGDQIGIVKVEIAGIKPMEVPVYAGQDVARLGLFSGAVEKAKIFFTGS